MRMHERLSRLRRRPPEPSWLALLVPRRERHCLCERHARCGPSAVARRTDTRAAPRYVSARWANGIEWAASQTALAAANACGHGARKGSSVMIRNTRQGSEDTLRCKHH